MHFGAVENEPQTVRTAGDPTSTWIPDVFIPNHYAVHYDGYIVHWEGGSKCTRSKMSARAFLEEFRAIDNAVYDIPKVKTFINSSTSGLLAEGRIQTIQLTANCLQEIS